MLSEEVLTRLVPRVDCLQRNQRKFKEDSSIFGGQESTSEERCTARGGKQSNKRVLNAEATRFDGQYIMKSLHDSDTQACLIATKHHLL